MEEENKKQNEAGTYEDTEAGSIEISSTSENINDDGQLTPEEIEMAKRNSIDITDNKPDENDKIKKGNHEDKKNVPSAEIKPGEQEIDLAGRQKIKEAVDLDLSPDEEHKLVSGYDANAKALYFRMKKNIKQRQAAQEELRTVQQERDLLKIKAKLYDEAVKNNKPATNTNQEEDVLSGREDDDVLTVAEVKRILAQKTKTIKDVENAGADSNNNDNDGQEYIEKNKLLEERAKETYSNLQMQEQEAEKTKPDFAEVCNSAKSIMTAVSKSVNQNRKVSLDGEIELEEMFDSNRLKIMKAKQLSIEFATLLSVGGKDQTTGRQASDVAYELGQLLYKSANKNDQGVGPEAAKKFIKNSQKGKPAAAVSGSGKITVPYNELTIEQVAAMTTEEFAKLPEAIRKRFL